MSLINELLLKDGTFNQRRDSYILEDISGKFIVKVEVESNPRKRNTLQQEYEILVKLNEKKCRTCPKVYEYGKIHGQKIGLDDREFAYFIQEHLPATQGYSYADVLLTILEQRSLGVYQGDIKHTNIRFDIRTGVCKFIDYDQAIVLEDNTLQLDKFQNLLSKFELEKYNTTKWYRQIEDIYDSNCIIDNKLNVAETYSMRMQKTTNTTSGLYHALTTRDLCLDGPRSLDDRARILDTVEFRQNEKVIDIGCNLGLLSHYLYDRGCSVIGYDNDVYMISSAQMINNIIGKNIIFEAQDLDDQQLPKVDTIMLFSVLHHTRNIAKNANKIANACDRVIIETRLVESGKQFIDGQWTDTSRWSFATLDQLTKYLEMLFVGFRYSNLCGYADKGRMILEFKRI